MQPFFGLSCAIFCFDQFGHNQPRISLQSKHKRCWPHLEVCPCRISKFSKWPICHKKSVNAKAYICFRLSPSFADKRPNPSPKCSPKHEASTPKRIQDAREVMSKWRTPLTNKLPNQKYPFSFLSKCQAEEGPRSWAKHAWRLPDCMTYVRKRLYLPRHFFVFLFL